MKRLLRSRASRITLAVAVVAAVMGPIAAYSIDSFTDVPDSNVFHSDIQWMADNAITQGCNPPTNTQYCPSSNVTREQMAAFMRRLSTNKVVDAATAVQADDSSLLDGKAGSHYENPIFGNACSSACPDGAALEIVELLTVTVAAPRSGVLAITTSLLAAQAGTNDFVQSWVTIDGDPFNRCGGWFFTPLDAETGSYGIMWLDGNIKQGTLATTTVASVSQGTHTVQLCTLGTEALDVSSGGLTTVFSAGGSSSVLLSATKVSQADLAPLKAAVGDL